MVLQLNNYIEFKTALLLNQISSFLLIDVSLIHIEANLSHLLHPPVFYFVS